MVWLVAILWLAASTQDVLAFGFSVEPARIELEVPAGERRGKTLIVNNRKASEPIHLTVYVTDVIYLPDGTHDFPPPNSTEWSCADWLRVVPEELDVPAGQEVEVRVSAAVPDGAAGGHYAMIFFETQPSYDTQGVGINFRLGALTEVVVSKTATYQATLASLAFRAPQEILIEVFNQGNILIRPKGKVKVFAADGKRLQQLEFNPQRLGVFPQTLRTYATPLEAPLASGSYTVKAELDYGTKYLLVGEQAVVVP